MISWAMRKLGVEEWLVSAVMSMSTGDVYRYRFRIKPVVIRDCHGGHI